MKPFRDIELGKLIASQWEYANNAINKMTNEEVLANDEELLVENLYQEIYIEPVEIQEEDISRRRIIEGTVDRYHYNWDDEYERYEKYSVPGAKTFFVYPFRGDSRLFRCYVSVFNMGVHPEIEVVDNDLLISVGKTSKEISRDDIEQKIMEEQLSILKQTKKAIEENNSHIITFNKNLKTELLKGIKRKKAEAESFMSLAKRLEIPIEKREYVKQHIDVKRRVIPTKKKYDSEPYYEIGDDEYNDILLSIRHTLATYERTPSSYKSMGEEDLRNALLATLNATYLGDATGETFRNKGKTDICIEKDSRAAFIAECKLWRGKSLIQAGIEQLDGYRTWRDCKVALIFFVRRKSFLNITEEAYATLSGMENVRNVNRIDRNEFECKYISKSHEGQIVKIRVMLFDLHFE